MSYLSRDRRSQSAWLPVTILFVVLVLLIWIFPRPFSSLAQTIGRPVWAIRNGISNSGFFQSFTLKSRLVKENEMREQKILELQTQLLTEQDLENQNKELKSILGGEKTGGQARMLANILAWPPSSPYDTLVIDAGANQGVKVGDKAFALGDLALGEVASVYSNSSNVRLYSTSGEKYQVRIVSASSTVAAAAEGRGGNNFTLSLPVNTPVNVGDVVLLPGAPSIILGQVEKIDQGANDSFKTVYFKLPVSVNNLRYLQIERQ